MENKCDGVRRLPSSLCAPRRACERRAAAAGWQVALAAAKFARLRTLDWTRVVGLRVSSAGSAAKLCSSERAVLAP